MPIDPIEAQSIYCAYLWIIEPYKKVTSILLNEPNDKD